MAQYATASELKTKNSSIELSHSDDEINELLEAASLQIDWMCDRDEGYFSDIENFSEIPKAIKMAAIYLALYLFVIQSEAGIESKSLAGISLKIELPERVERRLKILLSKYGDFYASWYK